jgi:long-chain acyl-CoA synthetase
MQGYLARPDATAETLRDGWLYTGDIGEFAEDGFLYIRDRKKDLVISGGYNVYPREVDEVLYLHPDVAEAAAVGWPDSYRGEVIRAFVVLRPGAAIDEAGLIAHCQSNLARYKVPAVICILDALPYTGANKVDKKALRAP